MLTAQDDLIGHQLPTTFDHVGTSDPNWMERYWYTAHPVPAGDIIFDLGLGYHPNRNVMDAHAGVTIGETQHNFRASRNLRPNALETAIGPLRITVLEGMRRHRLTLSPNDSGLSFDLQFDASMNANEEAHHFMRRRGRAEEDMARYLQFGRYEGVINVDGRELHVEPGTWWGQRDHAWGVRSNWRTDATAPPVTKFSNFLWMWGLFQFPDRGYTLFLKERAPGQHLYLHGAEVGPLGTRPQLGREVVTLAHDLVWKDDRFGQILDHGVLDLGFSDGSSKRLHVRALPARYYMKGGLYGGWDGWFQGDDKGKLFLAHDRWDLTDPETRTRLRTTADRVVEVRDGEAVGYGILEGGVAAGYPRYQSIQHLPAL